ncbi:helix-turn-helix domain-containing protein [Devosia sp. SL43]|uniref:helix-turn-helix domain-containing protein n=1 Tax=Devosia sp. SL43 TaxID=2806348 RepID=UPI001F00C227|nr:helix-turn-helix domain-containing protein [Devosia sp. SL43]UJW87004.1 helix-turn-helix domain-containing protein [Devosia sp. SL43]
MTVAAETPHRAVLSLLTGHFHETSGYRAVRRQGVGDWLLIHTVAGRGRFGHAGGELIAEPGDWVLLRPGTPHDYGVETSLQRWDLVWAHFQPRADWLAWLNWPEQAAGLMRLHVEDEAFGAQFLAVHGLLGSQRLRSDALAMNALEALLLRLDEHNVEGRAKSGDPRIHQAMDFLDRHLAEKLLIDDVADGVGLSPSRLAHLFKQQTGQTVQGYLEARRMQVAADLLRRTSFPIKQVAAAAGFESQFYFSQRFSRWTGLSPLAFRRDGH